MGIVGYNSNGWKLTGIYGAAHRETNTDGKYTYGIKGYAGRGGDGLNYGVMGNLIGDRNGTGILGCDSYNNEPYISGDYAGYFCGNVWVTGTLSAIDLIDRSSDIRTKKDVRPLGSDNISKLKKLNGIIYKLKHPTELDNYDPSTDTAKYLPLDHIIYTKDRIGLSAQEVSQVYPQLVQTTGEGYLQLNYMDLIPVLVEAIKQQQQEITSIQNQLTYLTNESQVLKSSMITSTEEFDHKSDVNTLFQNSPNPFTEETKIEYYLEDNAGTATMYIYDMSGKQLRSYDLHLRGKGDIIINGGELNAGMYIYTMIADGIVISSKQMILTNEMK